MTGPFLRGRRVTALVAALGVVLGALMLGSPARAADAGGARITHFEQTDGGVRMLVSVPTDATPDLSGVTVTIDGDPAKATAEQAQSHAVVRRTAILAIDTSDSMRGKRLAAAKTAAEEYVTTLPHDVYLGIVTFAGDVTTALAPSQDRAKASSIIDGLTLSHGTKLYDGVGAAIDLAGPQGQRSLLVLTDGADVGSSATLAQTATAVTRAKVLIDTVAVDESDSALTALHRLVRPADGDVLEADPATLQQRFEAEADALSRQLVVTATLPAGFTGTSGQVAVRIPTEAGSALTASALDTELRSGSTTTTASTTAVAASTVLPSSSTTRGIVLPGWAMYAGAAVVGLGLLLLLLALVPVRRAVESPEQRILTYTAKHARTPTPSANKSDTDHVIASAKKAADDLLRRNRGLEARISRRLEAAGSPLKPAEWLLLHLGVAVGVALLGLLVGGVLGGFIFLLLGAVGPWFYLGLRRSRLQKKFSAILPDTLQLISGSLSAGLSLAQAVDTVVREGQEPIASEFKRVLIENRLGVSLEDALEGIAERFQSKDFAWVVMAIKIQRQVGGNLAELLDTVAGTMRERQYLRRQVDALAAEGKLSAIVLGALPPLFLVYLLLTNRKYVMPLFNDPRGLVMFVGAILWLLVGIFWMKKLVKVEV
ncbi:type II secretion system F family protein [Nocardioides sp. DS6]|uniref:Type II secretion system F family protein n=1 Tax=Nocardioides eburneus TaxID=3231482 RepID=A0ABV3SWW5_9ACTN